MYFPLSNDRASMVDAVKLSGVRKLYGEIQYFYPNFRTVVISGPFCVSKFHLYIFLHFLNKKTLLYIFSKKQLRIVFGKQKPGVTFNFDKQDVIGPFILQPLF